MLIHTDLDHFRPLPEKPLVLGIGNFDGLHKGHQALLARVVAKARELKGLAAVFTFREHPQRILHPGSSPKLLTSLPHKLMLFEEAGIDLCFLISFTDHFSRIEATDFVRDILVKRFHIREVFLGYNAHFGHDRKGDVASMRSLASQYGFAFEEMPPVRVGVDFVSSSRIRSLIDTNQFEEAAECLGRPFSLLAPVIHGDSRGKRLGYPTANLDLYEQRMPAEGVYAVKVREIDWEPEKIGSGSPEKFRIIRKGPWLTGALNYGRRPTFHLADCRNCAEVYLLDFQGDLYGKNLEVAIGTQIRTEQEFPDAGSLQRQIAEDIKAIRFYFESDEGKKIFTR